MEFLLSPWFVGLSVISILVMTMIMWGASHSCRRHNASPMGSLCGKKHAYPCTGTFVISIFYAALTIIYILVPPIVHDLLL